jgi:elongation factor G
LHDLLNLEPRANLPGEFSMEYKTHAPVMPNVQRDMVDAFRKKQLGQN